MRINFKLFVLGLVVFAGCKKYDNPPAVFEELKSDNKISRKVIVISIDGLVGADLPNSGASTILSLQKNSKYTYNSLTSPVTTDASTWTSMLTGASVISHNVTKDNFQPDQVGSDPHSGINAYTDVLSLLRDYKNIRTAVVTPWPNLRNYLKNADFLPEVSTDVAVKDSTLAILKKSELGTAIVDFRDVKAGGNNGGFNLTNINYKNAIVTIDGYIKEIMAGIKSRPTYAKEDWLVVLTSNYGGNEAASKPGFLMLYQPSLKEEILVKRQYTTLNFRENVSSASVITNASFARVANDNGLYNMGDKQDFTVQMDVRNNKGGSYYPKFLGKSTASSPLTGWYWMISNTSWNLQFGGQANGGVKVTELAIANGVEVGVWHTLTMTVRYESATVRTASAYVDGVFKGSTNISAAKSLNTAELLQIGAQYSYAGYSTDLMASNLLIFNTALTASEVTANAGLRDLSKHTRTSSLIGYWPIDEEIGNKLYNRAPVGYNMDLTGAYNWLSLNKAVPPSVPLIGDGVSTLPGNTAITPVLLYWMNVKILPTFKIEGDPILNKFELEFLK
ncbi:hypothetical protein OQZ33_05430 [Pedobacter sp. MC2016-05]|uniref:LamG-like jellyroll fold domain-containing protein n=1 Tax=Pedobacter sp. MC2016-05 TaxID=2994474 RepID=UPI002247073F|nr:LamG-like jellyroll fold domain-containing protein [Pedobacter sp. MC2016-05]MCX2473764.1 hypothetical protein [Pedobacter sp. MC2016-05]